MTTLYKPVLIESAEQAEALPEGSVASRDYYDEGHGYHHYDCARKVEGGGWMQVGSMDDFTDGLVVGWTALVPIEAEEEQGTLDLPEMLGGGRDVPVTRLVTPWEEA